MSRKKKSILKISVSKMKNDSSGCWALLFYDNHSPSPTKLVFNFISCYNMDWDGAEARDWESEIFARNRSHVYLLVWDTALLERGMDGKTNSPGGLDDLPSERQSMSNTKALLSIRNTEARAKLFSKEFCWSLWSVFIEYGFYMLCLILSSIF